MEARIQNGLVPEERQDRLSRPPGVDLQSYTAQLAEAVRAWQLETSSEKLPKRDRSHKEELLAQRVGGVLKLCDANELPQADREAL